MSIIRIETIPASRKIPKSEIGSNLSPVCNGTRLTPRLFGLNRIGSVAVNGSRGRGDAYRFVVEIKLGLRIAALDVDFIGSAVKQIRATGREQDREDCEQPNNK